MNDMTPPPAASASAPTVTLRVPLKAGEKTITEVTLRPLTMADRMLYERGGPGARMLAKIACATGLDPDVVGAMRIDDSRACSRAIAAMETRQVQMPPEPGESGRSFPLTSSIVVAGKPVTELRLREPDLEAAVAMDVFETDAEQTIAIIAALSGVPIPAVRTLRVADGEAMEAWIGFFFDAGPGLIGLGQSMKEAGKDEATAEPVDGAPDAGKNETVAAGATSPSPSPANSAPLSPTSSS